MQVSIQAFKFDDLSDKAKDNVREWFNMSEFTFEDLMDEVHQFADAIGIDVTNWSIDYAGCSRSYIQYKYTPHTRFITTEGGNWYWILAKEWNKTRDVKSCFSALFSAIETEYEYTQTDEYISEHCEANEYLFDKSGKPIHNLVVC